MKEDGRTGGIRSYAIVMYHSQRRLKILSKSRLAFESTKHMVLKNMDDLHCAKNHILGSFIRISWFMKTISDLQLPAPLLVIWCGITAIIIFYLQQCPIF